MHFPTRRYRVGQRTTAVVSIAVLLGAAVATGAHASVVQRSPAAASPTYGGTYSYRTSDAADCLDPQKTGSATADLIDGYVFDTLLSIDNKGHYVGDLATKYKVANGGKRLTFTLRKHVVFSNGDPLTAADVKYTFNRALNPVLKSPVSASQLAGLKTTKVINTYTVELDLSTPNRPLLTNLASAYTGILDAKWFKSHGSSTCTRPVGSGPYVVKSTGGDFSTVVVVANKRHNFGPSWVKNKGVPYVTTVNFKAISSDATAISLLLSTGIDISAVPGTQLGRVQGHTIAVLHRLKSQTVTFVEFNVTKPPFNNIAMRRAFAQIINRQAILKASLSGLGQVINGPLAPGIPNYDKAAAKYMPKYNPSAAAKTFAANHATGPYTYLTVGIPNLSITAEILQQAAGQAGMQLSITTKAGVGDFVSDAAKGNFNIASLEVTYPDPDVLYLLLDSTQGGGKGFNFTGLASNPKLDALLEKGRTTLNSKKIPAIYDQAQVLINKQLDFIGVVAPTGILAVRTFVKGYHVDATGGMAIQDLYTRTK